jgi:hypothetical protein
MVVVCPAPYELTIWADAISGFIVRSSRKAAFVKPQKSHPISGQPGVTKARYLDVWGTWGAWRRGSARSSQKVVGASRCPGLRPVTALDKPSRPVGMKKRAGILDAGSLDRSKPHAPPQGVDTWMFI